MSNSRWLGSVLLAGGSDAGEGPSLGFDGKPALQPDVELERGPQLKNPHSSYRRKP
jgi:hypothetical protein